MKELRCQADDLILSITDEYAAEEVELTGPSSTTEALNTFFRSEPQLHDLEGADFKQEAYKEETPISAEAEMAKKDKGGKKLATAYLEKKGTTWRVKDFSACVSYIKNPKKDAGGAESAYLNGSIGLLGLIGAAIAGVGAVRAKSRIAMLLLLSTVATGGYVFIGTAAADLHCAYNCTGDTFYADRWKIDHHTGINITWRFTSGFPDYTQQKRSRVEEAFAKWSDLPTNQQFEQLGEVATFTRNCPSPYHGILWEQLSGPHARTVRCSHSGTSTLHEFHVIFDSGTTWYSGTDNPPAGEFDFKSAAVHEVGHATGFNGPYENGHFDGSADFCKGDTQQTMCPNMQAGTQYLRSLEEHDTHTFGAAY